jgi:hypothetical protein
MLGVSCVRERVMRRHYGFDYDTVFEEGYHPESRKKKGEDGEWRCQGVMSWYAKRVCSIYGGVYQ